MNKVLHNENLCDKAFSYLNSIERCGVARVNKMFNRISWKEKFARMVYVVEDEDKPDVIMDYSWQSASEDSITVLHPDVLSPARFQFFARHVFQIFVNNATFDSTAINVEFPNVGGIVCFDEEAGIIFSDSLAKTVRALKILKPIDFGDHIYSNLENITFACEVQLPPPRQVPALYGLTTCAEHDISMLNDYPSVKALSIVHHGEWNLRYPYELHHVENLVFTDFSHDTPQEFREQLQDLVNAIPNLKRLGVSPAFNLIVPSRVKIYTRDVAYVFLIMKPRISRNV